MYFHSQGDGSGGNRVFDGMEDDSDFGFGNFDGDESATFRDGDGSVTQCSGMIILNCIHTRARALFQTHMHKPKLK